MENILPITLVSAALIFFIIVRPRLKRRKARNYKDASGITFEERAVDLLQKRKINILRMDKKVQNISDNLETALNPRDEIERLCNEANVTKYEEDSNDILSMVNTFFHDHTQELLFCFLPEDYNDDENILPHKYDFTENHAKKLDFLGLGWRIPTEHELVPILKKIAELSANFQALGNSLPVPSVPVLGSEFEGLSWWCSTLRKGTDDMHVVIKVSLEEKEETTDIGTSKDYDTDSNMNFVVICTETATPGSVGLVPIADCDGLFGTDVDVFAREALIKAESSLNEMVGTLKKELKSAKKMLGRDYSKKVNLVETWTEQQQVEFDENRKRKSEEESEAWKAKLEELREAAAVEIMEQKSDKRRKLSAGTKTAIGAGAAFAIGYKVARKMK